MFYAEEFEEEVSEAESSFELEEYTVNSDSDEESKDEQNVRRTRIRRRGKSNSFIKL